MKIKRVTQLIGLAVAVSLPMEPSFAADPSQDLSGTKILTQQYFQLARAGSNQPTTEGQRPRATGGRPSGSTSTNPTRGAPTGTSEGGARTTTPTSPQDRSIQFGGQGREYVGEHREIRSQPTRSSTKGTSTLGPGISGEPRGRTEVTPPQGSVGKDPSRVSEPRAPRARGDVQFGGERREYVGEHRQGARIPEPTRSTTKGTSGLTSITSGPASRQTIEVGGPRARPIGGAPGTIGGSPKTGITVGVPVGTTKSIGVEGPSLMAPKMGSVVPGSQVMPVGGAPSTGTIAAPSAPAPKEAPAVKTPGVDAP